MNRYIAQGTAVPADLIGPLRDSSQYRDDGAELGQRMADDGYVFLREVVDREAVLEARREVFERLAEVGEIEEPAVDGIATGVSQRRELDRDLGAFWQSVCQGPALRHVSHGPQLIAVLSTILDEPARPHDYMFLRPGVVGRSTHLHYDLPFFARGSNRIHTAWLALGDIPAEEGPLMVLENSHRFDDLLDAIRDVDYDSSDTPKVQVLENTVEFARQRQARLLTADFQAGDVVVFGMLSMHGTLDNHSSAGRVRLSVDVRYQPEADPFDPRYMGESPPGTTGAGYGELNGAKPLTEAWHTR